VQEKLDLMKRVGEWLAKFLENHFETVHRPGAFVYRAAMLWCPLLKDGLCTVYDRRPIECRLFFAQGDPNKCADDRLRPKQKFMESPELVNIIMGQYMLTLPDGATDDYDHIGVLLAEETLCIKVESTARITIKRVGNRIEMIYPKKDVDTVSTSR
jgi:hypothetical protein